MEDVQLDKAIYPISIEEVGVRDIKYPVRILRKNNDFQNTVANIQLSVELPAENRGTHMSRFIEIIENYKADINGKTVKEIAKDIIKTFNCKKAYIKFTFPYFITKLAPVSQLSSIMETTCGYETIINNNDIKTNLLIKVPVTTLCPCSKKISKFGAHNQRAYIKLSVQEEKFVWFEDLINLVERCASAPIYPLLKRSDEKHVTELAYNNPKFVEDLVREIYVKLKENYSSKVSKVKIEVEADESIHTHKAFALIEKSLQETKEQ